MELLQAKVSDMAETLEVLQQDSTREPEMEMTQISMPRFRQGMGLRPVQSLKHVVETNGTVSAALISVTDVINTISNPVDTVTNACAVGSTVHAIYLRVEVVGTIAAGGVDNIYMGVYKNPANAIAAPNLDAVGTTEKRKFFIHQDMIMLAPFVTGGTQFPRTLFKGVLKIPRGYKRNGVDDKLQVLLQHRTGEATQTTRFCIECIYKEFR